MAGNPFARAARLQEGRWKASSFAGASHGRLYADWDAAAWHPDMEIRWALTDLRARARSLVRNNPYAKAVVDAFAHNVIGPNGIRFVPRAKLPNGDLNQKVNWELERAWKDWGRPGTCTLDGHESWIDFRNLLVRTWVTDGEFFLRQRPGFANTHAFVVELIDADLLDETYNVPPDGNGTEIRMGVEVDGNGRRLAYHFWTSHPTENRGRLRTRVSADQVIHRFVRYRAGQTRGFSLFAPVLTTLKMIDGYTEAELVASRFHASKMGFLENNTPEAIAAYAERYRLANDSEDTDQPEATRLEIAPGIIPELRPGQEFVSFDPTHPNTAFDPFLKVMLRGVARGFAMSYLTLTGDVGEANYSSMRAGLLPERDHWKILQRSESDHVDDVVYRSWLAASMLAGGVQLPSPVPSDYHEVDWRGRGWKWVDPLKDLEAGQLGIKLGVTSRQRLASEAGEDFEAIVDELAYEQGYAEDAGVEVGGDGSRASDYVEPPTNEPARRGANRVRGLIREESKNGTH